MLKMKKFPVKIDLSTFFEDERKYVIILVDPQWKNVEYLQRRVEEIFDVRPVRFLTIDNLFIPPQESIEVVEFTESLKAFIPKRALEESRRRSKQLKPETQAIVNNIEESIEKNLVKKRKYYTLGMDIQGSSTPNQTKKSRHTPKIVNQSPENIIRKVSNESQEITSTNEQLSLLKGCEQVHLNQSVEKKSICDGAKSLPSLVEKQSVTTNESKENSTSKRKRKRTHKESSALSMDFEEEKTELTLRPEVPSSTFLNKSKSSNKSSHIYFEDSTIMESKSKNQEKKSISKSMTNGKANTTKVSFKCKRSDAEFEKPVVFPLKYINKNNKPIKSIIDIQENILLQPANVDILCKAPVMNDTENQLEENVLSTTFNTTENKENETINEITNITETADNFEPENNANIITNGLDHINCKLVRDSGTEKEIQNSNTVKEIEDNNLKENSNCEGSINDEKDTITDVNSNGKDKNATNQSQSEISYNECNLNKEVQETVSSIDKIKQTNITNSTSTNMTEMSDYSQLMDESSVIDLDDDDEVVIDLSDAEDQQKSMATSHGRLSKSLNKSISTMSIDEMLDFCVPLTGVPELGDVIIFKFNRRISGAKIEESQFIACRCDHINRRTKALKLAVINASLENDVLPQKYKYSLDDTFEIRFMNIKFTEMIDPKVLKLSS
ncbi:coilin isoform X2 [Bactrocera dorsalis]|uniref:Coilin isoform X2 n=1 Tax=Bactrocera dorsalis TaxID=27457 RepID=A0A6I9VM28_BACDO|nr:coilin isoform X2 [Bactrocera dorsalis]